MAFDVQTLAAAATCAECLNQEQKQNVALYLLNQFVENGGSGGGSGVDCLHNLLSVIHPDTLPAAVSRGSLIVGNATPLWAELTIGAAGTVLTSDGADVSWAAPASAGTVTSFSAGNLAPLFTTSVATASTTPALTFSLSTQAANLVFAGPASGAAAGPTFRSLVALDLPATAVVPATYGSATQVGQFTVDQQGRITSATDVSITFPGGFSGFANPSALVGLAAVNGVATTAMRSDGAPALDQAIVPTWTGTHTFTASATIIGSAANALNAIQIVPPAALGSNMVDLFSDGGPGYNAIRKYFSSPFQVEIASSGSIDFVIDSNGNETGATVKFLTNALRGGVQTTLFTFFDNGTLVCSPTLGGAIQLNPFGVAAGNTSEIRYLELAANGTNYTGFKAPDALAASEMYVLPDAAPAANRFLRASAVSGGVSTLSWAQASLTADVTGTLPVGNGGTGLTAGTSGGILGFTAATTLASSVLLTANALVLGGGAGATPVPMASLGTTTTVLHGNAAGAPTFGAVVLTSDVSGILPVANGGSGTSTAFTAGSVIFAGAAGVYSQDNANLFWDDTNNWLGLGIAVPLARLHVVSSAAATVVEIVKAAAAQSANITEWQSSAGVANTVINAAGNINIPTTSSTVGVIFQNAIRLIHTFGTANLFIGNLSGNFTMTGAGVNVGVGFQTLQNNTTGSGNMAIGGNALMSNTTGTNNVGIGSSALFTNTTGQSNMAIGANALKFNLTGIENVGIGTNALRDNTASNNTAIGFQALIFNTTGANGVAIGTNALLLVTTGTNNIGLGFQAGDNLTTGANNIVLGHNIDSPTATNSNTLTIGNLIFGAGVDGTGVTLSSGGIGIGVITPTAKLHLRAGTTAASTAPLKFTSGTSLTTAEAGAVEFTTDDLFFTITTGAARKRILFADATAGLTSGKIPIATTNGRLIDLTASSAYTPTNVTTDRAYDANATTLEELSDVVGSIVADLQAKGILG